MSANDRARPPRVRRVAADEAHAWSRNLRLFNPVGKLVLVMLSGYVNGEGICWVGQESLAYDCDLSLETTRKKLVWLEKIGAIARSPRWLDTNGVRNKEGRGKRTSDDIKLLLFADVDSIEFLATLTEPELDAQLAGRKSAASTHRLAEGGYPKSSPPAAGGLIASDSGSAPASAPQQPPSYLGGSDSSEPEQELEDSPPAPSGGEGEPDVVGSEEPEPEHFAPAWAAWRGHEVMRRDLALAEFRTLSPDKQLHCRNAVALFNAMQDQLGRTRVPNFHLWIRSRGFDEFPTAAGAAAAAPTPTSFDVRSREGLAIKALYDFGKAMLFESAGRVMYPLPVTSQVLAFADAGPRSSWVWIEERAQIAAWSTFLSAHVHKARRELMAVRGIGAEQRRGIYAPWPWPPRKDGTISPASGDEPGSEVA